MTGFEDGQLGGEEVACQFDPRKCQVAMRRPPINPQYALQATVSLPSVSRWGALVLMKPNKKRLACTLCKTVKCTNLDLPLRLT